jgi:hypothetical protein
MNKKHNGIQCFHARLFERQMKTPVHAGCHINKERSKDQKLKTRSRSDIPYSISHCRPTDAEPEIFHTRDPALAERCRVATKEEIKRGMR